MGSRNQSTGQLHALVAHSCNQVIPPLTLTLTVLGESLDAMQPTTNNQPYLRTMVLVDNLRLSKNYLHVIH